MMHVLPANRPVMSNASFEPQSGGSGRAFAISVGVPALRVAQVRDLQYTVKKRYCDRLELKLARVRSYHQPDPWESG
jgi:hypothetical protein